MLVFVLLAALLGAYQILVAVLVQIGAAISARRERRSVPDEHPTLSVLVPAKDEQDRLPTLLASLEPQMEELVNVVLVNDRSTDATGSIMDEFAARHPGKVDVVHIRQAQPSTSPKLQAMKQGIPHVRGEVMLMTDADCELPREWARRTGAVFADPHVGLSIGPIVTRRTGSLLSEYSAAEHVYRYLGAAGLSGLGIPAGGFGNNMAIRVSTLVEVGGLDAVEASVTEDAALLYLVRNATRMQVRALMSRETTVRTQAVPTWRDLIMQLVRWQVGAVYTSDWESKLGMGMLIVGYIATIPFAVAALWHPWLWIQPIGALLGAGTMLVGGGIRLHQPRSYRLLVPVHFVLVILANSISGLYAFVRPRVVWKGAQITMSRQGPGKS